MSEKNSKYVIRPFKYDSQNNKNMRCKKEDKTQSNIEPYRNEFTIEIRKGFALWHKKVIDADRMSKYGELYMHVASTDTNDSFASLKVIVAPGIRNLTKKLITTTSENFPTYVSQMGSKLPLLYQLTIHSFYAGTVNFSNIVMPVKDYSQVTLQILVDPINSYASIVNVDLNEMIFNTKFNSHQHLLITNMTTNGIIVLAFQMQAKFVNMVNNGNKFPSQQSVFNHPNNKIVKKVQRHAQREQHKKSKQRWKITERNIDYTPNRKIIDGAHFKHPIEDNMNAEALGKKPKSWQGLGIRPRK